MNNKNNFFVKNSVPIFFIVFSIFTVVVADISLTFLLNELITRFARNSFLVLSLIIPVIAGLGLNFGIVLGAMAGQTGAIFVTHWLTSKIMGFENMAALERFYGPLPFPRQLPLELGF